MRNRNITSDIENRSALELRVSKRCGMSKEPRNSVQGCDFGKIFSENIYPYTFEYWSPRYKLRLFICSNHTLVYKLYASTKTAILNLIYNCFFKIVDIQYRARLFYLGVCKFCMSFWLALLLDWFDQKPKHGGNTNCHFSLLCIGWRSQASHYYDAHLPAVTVREWILEDDLLAAPKNSQAFSVLSR